jgi:hypothetical protein
MNWQPDNILAILDKCCDAFTFPMLDNGYVFLAATRLSLYRSPLDWGMVIEVFGFSPRAGLPDTHIYTFASTLVNRDGVDQHRSKEAYENFLASHPHNQSRFVHPIEAGDWQDEDEGESVAEDATTVTVRGRKISVPDTDDYVRSSVEPGDPPCIQIFEFCRALAAMVRDDLLATVEERRASLPPDMTQILQLEEWNHPNVVDEDARPSGSETFQQLAKVLATGSTEHYRPTLAPNTHWSNWPDGGSL